MKPKYLIIAVFFLIIIAAPILTLATPKLKTSVVENRTLQVAPSLMLESIFDKTFMQNTEKYLTDHFVGREMAVRAKTFMQLAMFKKEISSIFVNDKMLLEKIGPANEEITNENISTINSFANKHKKELETFVAIIPSAVEMYPQNAPEFADTLDQAQYIKQFYEGLDGATGIDVYSSLLTEKEKYIYYRTDHHWTSYGAYVGYKAMGSALGYRPASHDMFNIEFASYDFLGTLYSKVLLGENLADRVDLYTFAKSEPVKEVIKYRFGVDKNITTESFPSIFFRENLEKKDKYQTFLGANEPVVTIKTNVQNQKKLLMFMDSYSRPLMQFLPNHYEEITLVNLRYIKLPLSEYIDINKYDTALFIHSIAGFIDDESIKKVLAY